MAQELYDLPQGWEWKTIKESSKGIQYGYTAKAASQGNSKFLRITDIQNGTVNWSGVPLASVTKNELEKYRLSENDLVFARSGATSGKSILISNPPENAIFASYLIRVIPNVEIVIPKFLALFFQTPVYWETIKSNASGAAQPNINGTKLGSFDIPLPPLSEQKRIVKKLDALLSRIDSAIRELQESLDLSDQLFASALDRAFNPLQEENGQDGLYALPDGWEWKGLGDLFQIARGGSPRPIKSYLTEAPDGIHWVKIGDVKPGEKYITSTKEKIKIEGVKKSRMVYPGDFILSNSMSFGRPYIMKIQGCIHDGWLVLQPLSGELDSNFSYYVLSSPYIYRSFSNKASGTTVKNLNTGLVKSVTIPLPPLSEQKRIVKKLDLLSSNQEALKNKLQAQIGDLQDLKKSILDGAFRGKV